MSRKPFPWQDGALYLVVAYLHNLILEVRQCREVMERYKRQAESPSGAIVYLIRKPGPERLTMQVDVAALSEMILNGEVKGDWLIKRYSGLETEYYSNTGWQTIEEHLEGSP